MTATMDDEVKSYYQICRDVGWDEQPPFLQVRKRRKWKKRQQVIHHLEINVGLITSSHYDYRLFPSAY